MILFYNTHQISALHSTTFKYVKDIVSNIAQVPSSYFRLIWNGRTLHDDQLCTSIPTNANLTITLGLNGGAPKKRKSKKQSKVKKKPKTDSDLQLQVSKISNEPFCYFF